MAKKWSKTEIDYLMANYTVLGNKAIGDVIGRSAASVKRYMYSNGIRRTLEQLHIIRSELSKRPNSSHFKKGNVPHNSNYNGHERITKDGYVEIRVSKGDYRLKHRIEWENKYGEVPSGYCLKCKSGDITDTSPENWKLITRIENMIRNSKYQYPEEFIPSVVLVNQLKTKINSIEDGIK